MGIEQFKVKGRSNITLSCFKIIPDGEVKGVIQIFHGMGEHKDRYQHFATYMSKKGFAVYAHDHRKHGLSVNDPSEVGIFSDQDYWDYVIDDCKFVSEVIIKELPGKPIIILGHSMGSIIARKYISQYVSFPSMAIIMGTLPPITSKRAIVPLFLCNILGVFDKEGRSPFIAKLLNNPLNKSYKPIRTKFDWLSNDIANVDKYIEDPLCGYDYNPRFYKEFFKAAVDVNRQETILSTKDIPMLFISGEDDPVGDFSMGVKEIRELYSGHGYFKLTCKFIPKNRHEILNENEKASTYKYILNWVESNLEKSK